MGKGGGAKGVWEAQANNVQADRVQIEKYVYNVGEKSQEMQPEPKGTTSEPKGRERVQSGGNCTAADRLQEQRMPK